MLKDQISYLREQELRRERLLRITCQVQQMIQKIGMQMFRFSDLPRLTHWLPLLDQIVIPEDIYVIFPIQVQAKIFSFVITELNLYYIAQSPLTLVNKLSITTNRYPFEPYARKGTAHVLGGVSRKISYGNSSYTLMPLSSFKSWDNIWINPTYIEGTLTDKGITYGQFSFSLTVELPISTEALIKGMATSFIIHGLFARRKLQRHYAQDEPLMHFLQIRSTPLVLKAIDGLTVHDLPGKNNDLHIAMFRVYAEERGIVV